MLEILEKCLLCPRNCGVNRLKGELGFCKSGAEVKIAKVSLHKFEEPCISGTNGSGTVFFSNCSLRCCFCQNHDISSEGFGKEVTIERLSEIFLELQKRGAHNINLVTPTHFVPQIIEALKQAKSQGLSLPILYNCGGYEKVETLKLLEGLIDVYLPDIKYYDDKHAVKYSKAPKYFETAKSAVEEMVKQKSEVIFDENGLVKSGVIVRHLMLPNLLFDSKKIIDYISSNIKDSVYVSIMNQYIPMYKSSDFPEINRMLDPRVYNSLIDYALDNGIEKGFIQDEGTQDKSFIPEFDLEGV